MLFGMPIDQMCLAGAGAVGAVILFIAGCAAAYARITK